MIAFVFFIVKKIETVKAINGSGMSISNIDYNKVKITENNSIDPYSADAVTIPGAVAAWSKINQDYGKFSLKRY